MVKIFILFIISNPVYSQNIPGEWVGNIGFSESPVIRGNVCINPASADTVSFLSLNSQLSYDDYKIFDGRISSVSLTLNAPYDIILGGGINVLYNTELRGDTSLSNQWSSYTQRLTRTGGLDRYKLFINKSLGNLSLGFEGSYLSGEIEDRWLVDFDTFPDINDTLSYYLRGYSGGLGLLYELKNFRIGGYYSFYHRVDKWKENEEKEELSFKNPFSVGLAYSPDNNKMIMISLDRISFLIMGKYGPVSMGYGRIYDSGYELDVKANRFLLGFSLSLNKMPLSIILENRRYLGDFEDNKFICQLGFSISGREGGNE